jgi:hypothetical protein
MFPTFAGTPKLKYPLSRPSRGHGPQCCICWNDVSPGIKRQYKAHGTRRCPNYNTAAGQAVCDWLTKNPKKSTDQKTITGTDTDVGTDDEK